MPRSSVSSEDSAITAAETARDALREEAEESDTDAQYTTRSAEVNDEDAVERARVFIEQTRKTRPRLLPGLPYTTRRAPGVAPIGAGSDFLSAVARAYGSAVPVASRGQPWADLRSAAGGTDLSAYETRALSDAGDVGTRLVRALDGVHTGGADRHGVSWVKALTRPLSLALGGREGAQRALEGLVGLAERLSRYLGTTQQKFLENLPSVEPGLRLLEAFAHGEHGKALRAVAAHHCDEATSASMVAAVATARAFLELAGWQSGQAAAVKGAVAVAKEAAASKAVSRIVRPPPVFPLAKRKRDDSGTKEKRSGKRPAPAAQPGRTERHTGDRSAPRRRK